MYCIEFLCIALNSTAFLCFVLNFVALYCIFLYSIVAYFFVLFFFVSWHCIVLYRIVLYCIKHFSLTNSTFRTRHNDVITNQPISDPPQKVEILPRGLAAMVAGNMVTMKCRSVGGNPLPQITWRKGVVVRCGVVWCDVVWCGVVGCDVV